MGDLIPAKQAQFVGQRILRTQRTPSMAVGAQRIGKAVGIQTVALDACRGLAISISFSGLGVEGEDRKIGFKEPFNRRTT